MFRFFTRIALLGGTTAGLFLAVALLERLLTDYALDRALEFTGLERTGLVAAGLFAVGLGRFMIKRRRPKNTVIDRLRRS
jgi:hypothetical protein